MRGCDASFRLSAGQEEEGEEREFEDNIPGEGQGKTLEKTKRKKGVVGFKWGSDQQQSFEHIKRSIISNAVYGGDERQQYHLSTDASKSGLGGGQFQLINQAFGTVAFPKNRKEQRIIKFISKPFNETESRYSTTEREALAVVRCLEEVRWLVLGSVFPTKVYTDHQALVKQLQKDDAHGRIARWQVHLSEYDVEYIHIPGTQNAIADGLSRLEDCNTSTKVEIYSVDNTGRKRAGSKEAEREYDIRLEGWQEWLNED